MKQRVIISVLATVLILTLCVGVFVACNPKTAKYTVTFDVAYEGGASPEARTVEEGVVTELPAVERADYEFAGWKEEGTGRLRMPGTKAKITANTKFTAQWITAPALAQDGILLKFVDETKAYTVSYSAVTIMPQDYPEYESAYLEDSNFPVAAPYEDGKQFIGWFCEQTRDEETIEMNVRSGYTCPIGYPTSDAVIKAEKNSTLVVYAKYITLGALATSLDSDLVGTFYDYKSKFVISANSVKYTELVDDETVGDYVLHEFEAKLGENIYVAEDGYYVVLKDTATSNKEADYFFKISLDENNNLIQDTIVDEYTFSYDRLISTNTPALDNSYLGNWNVTIEKELYPGYVMTSSYTLVINSAQDILFIVSGYPYANLKSYANPEGGYYFVADRGNTYDVFTAEIKEGKLHFGEYINEYYDLEPNANVIEFRDEDNTVLGYTVFDGDYALVNASMLPYAPDAADGKYFLGFYAGDVLIENKSVGIADKYPAIELDENRRLVATAKYFTFGELANSLGDLNGTYYSEDEDAFVISDNTVKYLAEGTSYTATLGSSIYAADNGVYVLLSDDDYYGADILYQLSLNEGVLDATLVKSGDITEYEPAQNYGNKVAVEGDYLGTWTFTVEGMPQIGLPNTTLTLTLTTVKNTLKADLEGDVLLDCELNAYAMQDGGYYLVYEPGYTVKAYTVKIANGTLTFTGYTDPMMGGDKTCTAEVSSKETAYTVKFLDKDGETLGYEVLAKSGLKISSFPSAQLDGKYFLGWYQVVGSAMYDVQVTEDTVIAGGTGTEKDTLYLGDATELVLQAKYYDLGEEAQFPESAVGLYVYVTSANSIQRVIKIKGTRLMDYYAMNLTYFTKMGSVYSNNGGYNVILTPDSDDEEVTILFVKFNQDGSLTASSALAEGSTEYKFGFVELGDSAELTSDYYGKWEGTLKLDSFILNVDAKGITLETKGGLLSPSKEFDVECYANGNSGYVLVCDGGDGNSFHVFTISLDNGKIKVEEYSKEFNFTKVVEEEA